MNDATKKIYSGYLLKIKQEEEKRHDAVTLIFCAGTNCSWVHIPHFKVFKWRERRPIDGDLCLTYRFSLTRSPQFLFLSFFFLLLFHGIKCIYTRIKRFLCLFMKSDVCGTNFKWAFKIDYGEWLFWLKMLNSIIWCDLDVSFGNGSSLIWGGISGRVVSV